MVGGRAEHADGCIHLQCIGVFDTHKGLLDLQSY